MEIARKLASLVFDGSPFFTTFLATVRPERVSFYSSIHSCGYFSHNSSFTAFRTSLGVDDTQHTLWRRFVRLLYRHWKVSERHYFSRALDSSEKIVYILPVLSDSGNNLLILGKASNNQKERTSTTRMDSI